MPSKTIALPPDMPNPMKRLPRDEVGRPIPFFVAEVDGVHDFRVMDPEALVTCILHQRCWVCGEKLKRRRNSSAPKGTFVAGPMCLINRTSAEPPSHGECAEWSAKACPFLAKPGKERREAHMPEIAEMPGIGIMRNPGVTALIDSEQWVFHQVDPDPEIGSGGGILCNFSRVTNVRWMSGGRNAFGHEVLGSIDTGLPALMEMSRLDASGPRALAHKTRDAMRWVPDAQDINDYPNIVATLREL
jgi:hypothetical protein